MSEFIRWNSQPLDVWASKYAQGKFVELNGRTTHYIEKGEGKPVILLHGFFYDSYLWAANVDVLAEEFKVYALDLWGFGYSTREPMNYGYQLHADQVWIHNQELLTESYFENVTRFHKIKGTTEASLAILRQKFFDTLSDEIHHAPDK